ncbi:MAG TPA: GYF domain-containing protein [Fluviicola sp.]|nr:GYF domain-containing protein [Fluviicola sp.]
MKKYHYSDGQNQFGPLSIDELKDASIGRDTFVWFEGLESWTKAGEIEELKELFKSTPPPFPNSSSTPPPFTHKSQNTTQQVPQYKKPGFFGKPLGIATIVLVGIVAILAVLRIATRGDNSTDNYDEPSYYDTESVQTDESSNDDYYESGGSYTPASNTEQPKSAEELREELYRKEMRDPENYLSVSYDIGYRLLSGKDEIKGEIYNNATMATFKDVVLTVTYSSKTGAELGSENYVIYEYVYAGSSTPFNIRTYSPSGTKQIGVSVNSAKAE